MPIYHYKAKSKEGQALSGQINTISLDAAATQLLRNGITPLDIKEKKETFQLKSFLRRIGLVNPVSLNELVIFSRQMHTLTKAGVPITRALRGLSESIQNPQLSLTLNALVVAMDAGNEFSVAMQQHPEVFSTLMISMVNVGEQTGRLDEAFLQISNYLDLEIQTRKKIKAATRYPMMVIMAIVVALGVINILVIPSFATVFTSLHAQLPVPTCILIATSNFSVQYWPFILVAILGVVIWCHYFIKSEKGHLWWDKNKLKIPIFGKVIERATLARFARAFAMASKSGVPLLQALTVVAKAVDNGFVADKILSMRTGIERGETLSQTAYKTGLFTPLILQMLAVGEETGEVDELLNQVAGFYEQEVDYEIKRLGDAIEPILIIIMGGMVLILALGVFLPMWDLWKVALGR